MTPPLLSKPVADEPLQLYVAVSESSVSAVLPEKARRQLPVYYVSKSLVDAETSYDITYQPRTAIKSQALADFVADFSPTLEAIAQTEVSMLEVNTTNSKWILHVDGSSNFRGAGLGVLLKSPQGDIIARAVSCDFKATNNEAEYEALLAGLTLAKDLKATEVEAYSDSLLIIPRDQNTQADALANIGSAMRKSGFKSIPIVHLSAPAVHKATTADKANDVETDVNDIDVRNTAMRQQAGRPRLSNILRMDSPRRQATSQKGPYLRCLDGDECRQVLQEMHDGCCGNHSGGRSLSNRTLRMGYYWPTLRRDAVEYAKKCDACQRHAAMSHKPAERLHPTITPWPFMRWGMDIVGKLPQAPGQKVFMFGVPSEIICDNGSQFISTPTGISWLSGTYNLAPRRLGILRPMVKLSLATNQSLKSSKASQSSQRTTPRTATGQTPFSLVYGCEAVLPPEVRIPTSRYGLLTPDRNDEELSHDIVTSEELREAALVRMASQQQIVARSFNKNVKAKTFNVGDWVLREVFQNTKEVNAGKLAPAWEGPYKIQKVVGNGAYRLCAKDGKLIPRSWNAVHLKRYHF
ncbi:uncharacterized protein LOC130592103 [Beta vulgaris subsp. vulgaris]|uniref:uncharacterized protein LOC130592103 n=1 Tax=Beta vulgaris subsp. vulgaris TaxID=3555 RepID=UPI0025483C38|nr:uncharacterized protein LOC130592103 [Beta vulgaris subsp. vulgaris]